MPPPSSSASKLHQILERAAQQRLALVAARGQVLVRGSGGAAGASEASSSSIGAGASTKKASSVEVGPSAYSTCARINP